MVWTQRWLTGAAVIAVGLMIAPGAEAGWFGFGGQHRAAGQGVTLAQSGADNARLDQLERTIRDLTGQVETLQHQLDELTKQMQKMQADNEYRFGQLEQGKGGGKRGRPPRHRPRRRRRQRLPIPRSPRRSRAGRRGGQQLGAPPQGRSAR